MSRQQLKTEILEGPLADELAEHDAADHDQQIADILNRRDIEGTKPVPIADFVASLFETGAMLSIQMAVLQGNATAVIADRMVSKAKELGVQHIDLDLPVNQQLLASLLQAGIITQEQSDAATALAAVTRSRAQILFGRDIHPAEIGDAVRNP